MSPRPIGPIVERPHEARPPERETLVGTRLRLEPIDPEIHAQSLYAFSHGPDTAWLWDYLGHGPFADLADFTGWLEGCAGSADPLYFAAIDLQGGRACGMTAYMNIVPADARIEVGQKHARLVVVKLADDLAPGPDGDGAAPGPAPILVEAALGGGERVAAGLDGSGAHQHLPMRLARGPGEGPEPEARHRAGRRVRGEGHRPPETAVREVVGAADDLVVRPPAVRLVPGPPAR